MPAGATVIVKTQKIVVNPRTRQVAVINAGPQGPQGAPGPGGKNDYIRADGTVPMLSDLILPANPIDALAAIPKSYLENYAYDKAAADGRYIESAGDTMNGPLTIMSAASPATPNGLFFGGSRVHQMLNLYQTSYGIGVQSSAMYFRTGGTAQDFCWFQGGVHSDTNEDAGAGGRVAMVLRPDGLYLPDVNVTNLVIGNSASSGPRIRLHVPTTGDIVYLDFAGNGAAGTESMYFRAGTVSVLQLEDTVIRAMKAIYLNGAYRSFVASANNPYIMANAANPYVFISFYGAATNVDTPGTRSGYIGFPNSTNFYINNELNGGFLFYTNGAERMRVEAGGILNVGRTSSAAYYTDTGCDLRPDGRMLMCNNTAVYSWAIHIGATANANGQIFWTFRAGDGVAAPAQLGSITQVNSTGVAYNTTSHGPHKGNVQDLDDDEAIERVLLWRPVSYQWKFDENGRLSERGIPQGEVEHGFIAQEMNLVNPNAVTEGHGTEEDREAWEVLVAARAEIQKLNVAKTEEWDALVASLGEDEEKPPAPELLEEPEDPGDDPFLPWAGDWSKLVPDLTAAMQALIRRNEALTARVEELERMVR